MWRKSFSSMSIVAAFLCLCLSLSFYHFLCLWLAMCPHSLSFWSIVRSKVHMCLRQLCTALWGRKKQKVTDSLTQSVTRSPIKVSWTAKRGHNGEKGIFDFLINSDPITSTQAIDEWNFSTVPVKSKDSSTETCTKSENHVSYGWNSYWR